jgi:hypothetical protein
MFKLMANNIDPIFEEIKSLVTDTRNRVYTTFNIEMINLYWNIGKIIMEIQQGDERANYGEAVLEKLNLLNNISCKCMMGEYLLYNDAILFGGIYDNRLLIKIVDSNKKYNMQEQIPYNGAKSMYLVDEINNEQLLRDIIIDTCKDL